MDKHIYICRRLDPLDDSEFEFFDNSELLFKAYNSVGIPTSFTWPEFVRAIENDELITERDMDFYREVVTTS